MQKIYFHNNKSVSNNKHKKETFQILEVDTKGVVDINILLNRVKIEQKNEIKRKAILFGFTTIVISLFITFILIIK